MGVEQGKTVITLVGTFYKVRGGGEGCGGEGSTVLLEAPVTYR